MGVYALIIQYIFETDLVVSAWTKLQEYLVPQCFQVLSAHFCTITKIYEMPHDGTYSSSNNVENKSETANAFYLNRLLVNNMIPRQQYLGPKKLAGLVWS